MNVFNAVLVIVLLMFVFLFVKNMRDVTKPIYDGQIVITVAENSKKTFSLELLVEPEELEQKESVTFKIVSVEPPSG